MKFRRFISLTVLIAYVFTSSGVQDAFSSAAPVMPQAVNLAAASINTDMIGLENKDVGRLKMVLQAEMRNLFSIRPEKRIVTFEDVKKIMGKRVIKDEDPFYPREMHVFFHEAKKVDGAMEVKCRVHDKEGTRTYTALMDLTADDDNGFPVRSIVESEEPISISPERFLSGAAKLREEVNDLWESAGEDMDEPYSEKGQEILKAISSLAQKAAKDGITPDDNITFLRVWYAKVFFEHDYKGMLAFMLMAKENKDNKITGRMWMAVLNDPSFIGLFMVAAMTRIESISAIRSEGNTERRFAGIVFDELFGEGRGVGMVMELSGGAAAYYECLKNWMIESQLSLLEFYVENGEYTEAFTLNKRVSEILEHEGKCAFLYEDVKKGATERQKELLTRIDEGDFLDDEEFEEVSSLIGEEAASETAFDFQLMDALEVLSTSMKVIKEKIEEGSVDAAGDVDKDQESFAETVVEVFREMVGAEGTDMEWSLDELQDERSQAAASKLIRLYEIKQRDNIPLSSDCYTCFAAALLAKRKYSEVVKLYERFVKHYENGEDRELFIDIFSKEQNLYMYFYAVYAEGSIFKEANDLGKDFVYHFLTRHDSFRFYEILSVYLGSRASDLFVRTYGNMIDLYEKMKEYDAVIELLAAQQSYFYYAIERGNEDPDLVQALRSRERRIEKLEAMRDASEGMVDATGDIDKDQGPGAEDAFIDNGGSMLPLPMGYDPNEYVWTPGKIGEEFYSLEDDRFKYRVDEEGNVEQIKLKKGRGRGSANIGILAGIAAFALPLLSFAGNSADPLSMSKGGPIVLMVIGAIALVTVFQMVGMIFEKVEEHVASKKRQERDAAEEEERDRGVIVGVKWLTDEELEQERLKEEAAREAEEALDKNEGAKEEDEAEEKDRGIAIGSWRIDKDGNKVYTKAPEEEILKEPDSDFVDATGDADKYQGPGSDESVGYRVSGIEDEVKVEESLGKRNEAKLRKWRRKAEMKTILLGAIATSLLLRLFVIGLGGLEIELLPYYWLTEASWGEKLFSVLITSYTFLISYFLVSLFTLEQVRLHDMGKSGNSLTLLPSPGDWIHDRRHTDKDSVNATGDADKDQGPGSAAVEVKVEEGLGRKIWNMFNEPLWWRGRTDGRSIIARGESVQRAKRRHGRRGSVNIGMMAIIMVIGLPLLSFAAGDLDPSSIEYTSIGYVLTLLVVAAIGLPIGVIAAMILKYVELRMWNKGKTRINEELANERMEKQAARVEEEDSADATGDADRDMGPGSTDRLEEDKAHGDDVVESTSAEEFEYPPLFIHEDGIPILLEMIEEKRRERERRQDEDDFVDATGDVDRYDEAEAWEKLKDALRHIDKVSSERNISDRVELTLRAMDFDYVSGGSSSVVGAIAIISEHLRRNNDSFSRQLGMGDEGAGKIAILAAQTGLYEEAKMIAMWEVLSQDHRVEVLVEVALLQARAGLKEKAVKTFEEAKTGAQWPAGEASRRLSIIVKAEEEAGVREKVEEQRTMDDGSHADDEVRMVPAEASIETAMQKAAKKAYDEQKPEFKEKFNEMVGVGHKRDLTESYEYRPLDLDELKKLYDAQSRAMNAASREAGRDYLEQIGAIASEVGVSISRPVLDKPYTIFVAGDVFKDKDEYEQEKVQYASRFNLERINTDRPEDIIERVLGKIQAKELDPNNVIVQLSDEFVGEAGREYINKLMAEAPGIKFVIIDTKGLKEEERRFEYRRNLFSMMLLARKMDKDTPEGSPLFILMKFFVMSLLPKQDAIYADMYVNALKNSEITLAVNTVLSYKPVEKYDMPEYEHVSATLISA